MMGTYGTRRRASNFTVCVHASFADHSVPSCRGEEKGEFVALRPQSSDHPMFAGSHNTRTRTFLFPGLARARRPQYSTAQSSPFGKHSCPLPQRTERPTCVNIGTHRHTTSQSYGHERKVFPDDPLDQGRSRQRSGVVRGDRWSFLGRSFREGRGPRTQVFGVKKKNAPCPAHLY